MLPFYNILIYFISVRVCPLYTVCVRGCTVYVPLCYEYCTRFNLHGSVCPIYTVRVYTIDVLFNYLYIYVYIRRMLAPVSDMEYFASGETPWV